MPQTVEIPGQGIAEFPDEMSPDDIKGVIQNKFYGANAPSLPTQEIQPKMGLADMLFDPETAQNLRAGIQDVVFGLPQMAADLPKFAYEGVKFATGGPQEQAKVGMEALTNAKIQGQQMASDVQSPLGTRESFRGLLNVGMMAAPALGELAGQFALGGRSKPPIQSDLPITDSAIQATPQIPEGQITGTVTQQPKPQEVIQNAVQEPGTGEVLQRQPQEVGATGGGRTGVEQGVQGQETPQASTQEVAPIAAAATRMPDGTVFTGLTHGHAMNEIRAQYGNEIPEGYELGYVDKNGEFLNKQDALDRATVNRQISKSDADKMLQEQKDAGISEQSRGLEAIKFNALRKEVGAVPQPEPYPSLTVEDRTKLESMTPEQANLESADAMQKRDDLIKSGATQGSEEYQRANDYASAVLDKAQQAGLPKEPSPVPGAEAATTAAPSTLEPPVVSEVNEGLAAGEQPPVESRVQPGQFGQKGYTAIPTEEGAKPPVQTEPSGISTERLQQTYGKDAVLITKGRSPEAFQKIGESDTRDPYAVLSKAQQMGIAPPDDVPVLRVEHQRLLNDARAAYGTPEYNELAQKAVDFSNAIKTVAHGPASDIFRSIQDVDKPRFDSPADFDNIIRERMNRESNPVEQKTFKKVTDEVRNGDTEARQSADAAQKRLSKFNPKEEMKFEDAADFVKKQIADLTAPCVL